MSSSLDRLEQAERMLAEVSTAEGARQLINFASAARVYARQMSLGTAAVNHATEIRLLAECRLADVVDEGQARGEIATPEDGRPAIRGANTYEDLGLVARQVAEARLVRDVLGETGVRAAAAKANETGTELGRYQLLREARMLRARERHPDPAGDVPPPSGRYRCIVIDPPWPVRKIERETRPDQGATLDYPTMTLGEIAALPIPDIADPDGCHIYLWTTHKYLPDGLGMLAGWGARYQCVMTWAKNVGMTPFSWMYSTEHVLFARIGSLDLLRNGLRLDFAAPAAGHSVKPAVFYERVIEASPGARLEMFARTRRDGFDAWGNEISDAA